MASEYLDKTGLQYLWGKISDKIASTFDLCASVYIGRSTWADIYEVLSKIPNSKTVNFRASSAATATLSDGKHPTSVAKGTISRDTGDNYDIMSVYGTGQYIYCWRVSGLSSADVQPTIGTVYRYSGTSV